MGSLFTLWLVLTIVLVFVPPLLAAQQATTFGSASGVTYPRGNVICSGSINFMTMELFFERGTRPHSLKKGNVTWNQLEQLLDNLYDLTTGTNCNDANGSLPFNFTGYPTYRTGASFIRRPTFGVTLPVLEVFGFNYNPATGAEMRMLNAAYAGTTGFVVSGVLDGQATGCSPVNSDPARNLVTSSPDTRSTQMRQISVASAHLCS